MGYLRFLSTRSLLIAFGTYFALIEGKQVWTNKLCYGGARGCPREALVLADNYRVIGNKVDHHFSGEQDVWAGDGASVFASNILVRGDTGWPRIYEGCTYPLYDKHRTPGYPVALPSITRAGARQRYIVFDGQWGPRTHGSLLRRGQAARTGAGVQHGAYLWFCHRNKGWQWNPYPRPRWPYDIEVNVWNRFSGGGFRPGAKRFRDYYDYDGRYEVRGHWVNHNGDAFYAYYVTLADARRGRDSMNVNVNELLRHLQQHTWDGDRRPELGRHHELVEVSVTAEARPGVDAKFTATIDTMGR